MNILKRILFVLSALIILAAASMQLYVAAQPEPERIIEDNLRNILPAEVEGWEVVERDTSPEMETRAADILQYTDSMTRDYVRGGTVVSVYVGYWAPGKMPYNLIGSHTPDTCWVSAGFDRLDRSHLVEQSIKGEPLKPHEWGVYAKDGIEMEVIFWHILANGVYNYDPNYVGWRGGMLGKLERGLEVFTDFDRYGIAPQKDQVFLRISSNRQFKDLWDDPDFQRLLETFRPLGIFAEDEASL